MLVAELERNLLRGEEAVGSDLILQELRHAIRAAGRPVARIDGAARLFFAPVEPFLVDDAAGHKRKARIARAALEPIWEWIGRDLIPVEAKALGEDINRALLVDDRSKAEQVTRVLQDRALAHIREAVGAVTGDDKARRRLAVQVGTPRALDDLATLTRIFSNRDALGELARRLPYHLRSFERDEVDAVTGLLEAAVAQKTNGAAPAAKSDVYLCTLGADHGASRGALAAHSACHPRGGKRCCRPRRRNAVCGCGRNRDQRNRMRGARLARRAQGAPPGGVVAQEHPRRGARPAHRD